MSNITQKTPKGAGRPPTLAHQTESLVKRVMTANKKIDTGLSKIADEYPDLVNTAVNIALGRGHNIEMDANGVFREIPRNPSIPMLKTLLDIGINMVDKTGEGPDSPSQRILSAMRNKVTQLTQVNIDTVTIIESDADDGNPEDSVEDHSLPSMQ